LLLRTSSSLTIRVLGLGFGLFSYLLTFLVQNIPGLVQAWLGIFGVFGGPVLGLFSLGLYVPWASARAALTSAVTSLIFILWVALGGNISRVEGAYSAPKLDLQVDGCPSSWNISTTIADGEDIYDSWWPHLPIYEISYMWYSGISCCWVIFMGSILSLVPGFKQEGGKPDPELLVPVDESLFCCWPTSISTALIRFWGRELDKASNKDFEKDLDKTTSKDLERDKSKKRHIHHPAGQEISLIESKGGKDDTCIFDVAK